MIPTHSPCIKGDTGKSAYEIAVINGFVGTQSEWLISLKGEAGSLSPEQIDDIISQIPIVDISGKVDKVTGEDLLATTEAAKIHSPGSDNQDLSNLVVKVTGKGLSANDYSTIEQTKLSGISSGAQINADITKAEIEAKLTGQISTHTHAGGSGLGYAINVQALTSSPADSATVYFGMLPKAPTTSANISKVYIRKAGTIKIAEIYCYSGTAGTAESWSLYIRKNNSVDTLIKTLAVSASERVFTNEALSIPVVAGDYIEIKGVQPLWATNPLTTIYGGYIYIE